MECLEMPENENLETAGILSKMRQAGWCNQPLRAYSMDFENRNKH